MASDGEEMDLTSAESEVSAAETDTDTKEDAHVLDSETDEESLDVEVVPASSDDADMEELLGQLEDYTPTVPDALTMRILKSVRIVFDRDIENYINLNLHAVWLCICGPTNCTHYFCICTKVHIGHC